jgi:uncharacterized protein with GYD domain
MPKYLIIASYKAEGIKGVLEKGGSSRRDAVAKTIADVGGQLESFYFSFGDEDAFVIADVPDNVTAAAVAMNVSATGVVSVRTVVLLTPEEIDRAAGIKIGYRKPGS